MRTYAPLPDDSIRGLCAIQLRDTFWHAAEVRARIIQPKSSEISSQFSFRHIDNNYMFIRHRFLKKTSFFSEDDNLLLCVVVVITSCRVDGNNATQLDLLVLLFYSMIDYNNFFFFF